jgi:hypothetical protein
MQVPAAFLTKGGEYRSAEFMDNHAQPSLYYGAGYVPGWMATQAPVGPPPGSFADLDAFPSGSLRAYYDDNAGVLGQLLLPGVKNVVTYG